MKVVWTRRAIDQALGIKQYIAQSSPVYAQALLERIVNRTEQLESHPRSGRTVPEIRDEAIRELIEAPYRIIYRVLNGKVEVLAVIHGRMQVKKEKVK